MKTIIKIKKKIFNKKKNKIENSGDCRPSQDLVIEGKNATILIHEATFGESLIERAKEVNHSTIEEAIKMGIQMKAWRVALTHFSQRYTNTHSYHPFFDKTSELYPYSLENCILVVDHLSSKVSDFEYLPYLNYCLREIE